VPREMRRYINRGKKLVRNVTDLVSVLCVCLLPVLVGAVFFRVLMMGGAPFWFYLVCGLFFISCLSQTIYFFLAGLIGALQGKKYGGQEEGFEGFTGAPAGGPAGERKADPEGDLQAESEGDLKTDLESNNKADPEGNREGDSL